MNYLFVSGLSLFIGFGAFAQDHQNLAPTPPMDWNSWNLVEKEGDEQILKGMADALVNYGMKIVADYIHSKGLKPVQYSDAGSLTCAGVTERFGAL